MSKAVAQMHMNVRYAPAIAGGSPMRPKTENYPLRVDVYASHELLSGDVSAFHFDAPRRSKRSGRERSQLAFDVDVPMRMPESIDQVFAPLRDAGAYTFASVGRLFESGKISRSVRVVFNAYATTRTDEGEQQRGARVLSRVGTATLDIDLITLMLGGAPDQSAVLALLQNTNNVVLPGGIAYAGRGPRSNPPLKKGTITVRRFSFVDMHGRPLSEGVRSRQLSYWRALHLPAQPRFDVVSVEERAAAAERMRDVVIRSMRAFCDPGHHAFLPRPTLPFMSRFHCPEDRLADSFVPSLAYLINRPRRASNKSYYLAALGNVLRRRMLDARSLLVAAQSLLERGVNSVAHHAVLGIMVRMLTLLATTMPYLDDFSNANVTAPSQSRAAAATNDDDTDRRAIVSPAAYSERLVEAVEDMKIARTTGADDCEGVALEIYMQAVEMSGGVRFDATTPPKGAADAAYLEPLAATLQRILRLYVPCTALMAVTNKKLTYAAAHMRADDALAHTVCILIPYKRFEGWLSEEAAAMVRSSTLFYAARSEELPRAAAAMSAAIQPLPVLVCEGTSRMDPAMLPLSRYYTQQDRSGLSGSAPFRTAAQALADSCAAADLVQGFIEHTLLSLEVFCTMLDEPKYGALARNHVDLSNFYKHVISCQTVAFASLRVMDFTFVYPKGASGRGPSTFGITFNDFMLAERHSAVGLVPHLQLTQDESATIDMLIGAEEPVPPLANSVREPIANPLASLPLNANAVPSPTLRARLAALKRYDVDERKRRRRLGRRVTVLNARKIVLSTRVQDIGTAEIDALEASVALLDHRGGRMFYRVEVHVFRVADAVLPGETPAHAIDVSLSF